MNLESSLVSKPRRLHDLFVDHLQNSIACGNELEQLFLHLDEPAFHIARIKSLEEEGDTLIAEAYDALETLPDSELNQLTQQLVKRLDDIIDGMNNTARVIDIFTPIRIEHAAQQLLSTIMAMLSRLLTEVEEYPNNELSQVRRSREALKEHEETADTIYHDWRKAHRRHGTLSLIAETDWTEILGILEQTTDACYHAVLLLERIAKLRLRQSL